jgi:hypothetical protein
LVLALVSALTGLIAVPAAASPAFPPVSTNEGCTDWYLQDWYPMSQDDPQWVFRCSWEYDFSPEDWTGTWVAYDYYWNADSSQVIEFAGYVIEWGWYGSCVRYPSGIGACDA